MSALYLLGVDVGSSAIKAGIYSPDGRLIGLFSREYDEVYPKPGWKEIDPGIIWAKTIECIRGVLAGTEIDPRSIMAISPSTRGEEVVPVDRAGKPLYNFITAMDKRDNHYEAVIRMWRREMDPNELYERTGVTLTILPSIHRMVWIKEKWPEIYAKTHKFCCVEDFLLHRLSGVFATDYSLAGRTMAFNRNTKKWDRDVLGVAGLEEDKLCEALPAGTPIGKITSSAAAATGLSRETLVVTGGHDQCCAALGAGAVEAGCAFNGLGTVESIGVVTATPLQDQQAQEKHQACYPHVVSDRYLVLGLSMAFGLASRRMRKNVFHPEDLPAGVNPYDAIMANAARAVRGCHGLFFLPHFQGSSTGIPPAFNSRSRACLIGLREYHTNDDICRAVLEGLCLETRAVIGAVETSCPISQMRATGGPTRSDFLMQLKSDVTNKEIQVLEINEAGVIGAVILAGIGAGVYRTCAEALPYFDKIRRTFVPDRCEHEFYEKAAAIYDRIYPSLLEVFGQIADSTPEAVE